MQNFKILFTSFSIAVAALLPLSSMAQSDVVMTRGEVRKVDKDTGKITIRHEEIKNLEMPPMTMVFTVKDKSILEKVQAGDTVKFVAISEGGKLVVTDLQSTKP